MSFFDSEIVRSELAEISELQEVIYKKLFQYYSMSAQEKIEHIELLQKLLEKQQILYNRLSFSDDPEARELKEKILKTASSMGLSETTDMNLIFNNMSSIIDMMKKQIDKSQ